MVDYELDELKREFLDEARTKITEMDSALENTDPKITLEKLAYLGHQLKGSGGSYGYADISSHAAELEKAVEAIGPEALEGNRGQLREYVDGLRAIIEAAAVELS